MLRWLRDWLWPPKITPVEEQLELPFDPPLPRYKTASNNRPTSTRSSQENL